MVKSEADLPAEVRVLLQQCRLGKGDLYGRRLKDECYKNRNADYDMAILGISDEVWAYYHLASYHRVTQALERWRRRPDEVDAEIVLDNRAYLEDKLSLQEIHAIWYDYAAKKARDFLEQAEKSDNPSKATDLLYRLHLLTLDIPTETDRPFPYDKVFQGYSGHATEETLRAHVLTAYLRLKDLYRRCGVVDGGGKPIRYLETVLSSIKHTFMLHAVQFWGFSLEELDLSEDKLEQLAQQAANVGLSIATI